MAFLPGAMTRDMAAAFVETQNTSFSRHGCCYFAAELRDTHELAGFIGLKYQDFPAPFSPCFEIGWRLASAHWRRGLATEGALAVLAYGFSVLGLNEIVSFTVPNNERSRRVMDRIGMKHDPDGDFAHPALPTGHRLSRHVLYRMRAPSSPKAVRP